MSESVDAPTKLLEAQLEQLMADAKDQGKISALPFASLAGAEEKKQEQKKTVDYAFLSPVEEQNMKYKSLTPVPISKSKSTSDRPSRGSKKPYIIGICGGPSSGMSTVAYTIKDALAKKSGISCAVLNLVDFYIPLLGDLRRKSRSNSLIEEESTEQVEKRIKQINQETDFDDPKQIDFDLLIVSFLSNFSERFESTERKKDSF